MGTATCLDGGLLAICSSRVGANLKEGLFEGVYLKEGLFEGANLGIYGMF